MKTKDVFPVFGLLKTGIGTTLIHAQQEGTDRTLCGIDDLAWLGWYGDGDLTLDDVECQTCLKKLESIK